jgi:integrase
MSYLRRRGDIWFFRRIMPNDVREQLARATVERTLGTRSYKTALMRAAACYVVTENAIAAAMAGDPSAAAEMLATLSTSPPWAPSQKRDMDSVDAVESAAQPVSLALPKSAVTRPTRPPARGWVTGGGGVGSSLGPLFSDFIEPFIAEKCRSTPGHNGYNAQTVLQTRVSFRLWMELVGDVPLEKITGTIAGRFRDELLMLPASHGKGGKVSARKVLNRLLLTGKKQALSGVATMPTLSMKTTKRHFSTLSQYSEWLRRRDHLSRNPFAGFEFPGTGPSRSSRNAWSDVDLCRVLSSSWLTGQISGRAAVVIGADAARWVPLIAMFSGMRLEEICRLRAIEDCIDVDGVPAFMIQEQPAVDGLYPWSPKTAAGERTVPVHPELLRWGLGELIAKRRRDGDYRLFPLLRAGGPELSLGDDLSRRFSKMKVKLHIDSRTTFHSFRHNVSTILRNQDSTIREVWIDAVLGHDGGHKSAGISTYMKTVGIGNLQRTVNAISYSDAVMSKLS